MPKLVVHLSYPLIEYQSCPFTHATMTTKLQVEAVVFVVVVDDDGGATFAPHTNRKHGPRGYTLLARFVSRSGRDPRVQNRVVGFQTLP